MSDSIQSKSERQSSMCGDFHSHSGPVHVGDVFPPAELTVPRLPTHPPPPLPISSSKGSKLRLATSEGISLLKKGRFCFLPRVAHKLGATVFLFLFFLFLTESRARVKKSQLTLRKCFLLEQISPGLEHIQTVGTCHCCVNDLSLCQSTEESHLVLCSHQAHLWEPFSLLGLCWLPWAPGKAKLSLTCLCLLSTKNRARHLVALRCVCGWNEWTRKASGSSKCTFPE